MAQRYNGETDLAILSRRVRQEQERAARALRLVAKYEKVPPVPELRSFYSEMAQLHRRLADRHVATAELHEKHLSRVEAWLSNPGRLLRPTFLGTVAATLDIPRAAATLWGLNHSIPVVVAASDATAQAAQDLERVMGEGPAATVVTGDQSLRLAGTAIPDRWPLYGPAAAELGVHAVIGAPLRLAAQCIGAVCVYDTDPVIRPDTVAAATTAAETLTQAVLNGIQDDHPPAPFEDVDFQPLIHQAAGMIAIYHDCSIRDADTLLRAYAFAENRPVIDIARDVTERRTRLT